MKTNLLILTLLILSTFTSCSEGTSKYPHLKISKDFTKPQNPESEIFIAYTSNFNGRLNSHNDEFIKESKIRYGGADLLKQYISALRNNIENLLVIDGGQLINDLALNKDKVTDYISGLNYDAVLLSDHDLISFKNVEDTKLIPFVNSNLISLDTNESLTLHNNQEYIIKEIGGLRIGIIGLTPYKPVLKSEDGLEGILFDDVVARIINIKKKIKGKTDFNIGILHSHTKCSDIIDYKFKHCKIDEDFIKKILMRLPPDTIDLFFTGNAFVPTQKVLNYPIVSNLGHGEFITLAKIDVKSKEVKAEQVRVCSHFYKETGSCYVSPEDISGLKDIRKSRLKLVPATVLGQPIL